MATSANRDVSLKILVDAVGEESVDELRAALAALAKEGAGAAPEVKRLTDQIDRLTAQAAAVDQLQQLGQAATELAAKQESASTALAETSRRLGEQRTAVVAAREAQAQANVALTDAQKAYNETEGALKVLRSEYDAAGKKTADYRSQLAQLVAAQVEQKNTIIDLRAAQAAAAAEVTQAVAGQTQLETAQRRATSAAQAAVDAAQSQGRALAEAREAASALGIATENLVASQGDLQRGVQGVTAEAQAFIAASREMAESDRLLAIQQASLNELLEQGAVELRAEEAALRDAARAAREYEQIQAATEASSAARNAAWQREAAAIVDAAEASQRLQRETAVLVATQAELGRQAAFEQQAKDAQKLMQAASYVSFWEQSLREAEEQERALAAASAATTQALVDDANRIKTAFSTLGVRGIEELRLEITQTRNAMAEIASQAQRTGQSLSGAFAAGEAKIAALEREIRELNGTMTLADRTAKLFQNSMGQITAGNLIADGIGYMVEKVKELGREFVATVAQTERLRLGLQAVYKDAGVAAAQFDTLRSVAQASGLSISGLSDSFLRFSASMKSSNISLADSNALFAAVTRAGASLGLSNDAVSGSLDALGQIASKGVVSLEELRQQLGDRLPGAMGLAAKGLGITQQELIKLVESGNLAAEDFFPSFTKGLQEMAGDTNTLTGAYTRFTNALTIGAQNLGDAGGLTALKVALQGLTVLFATIATPIYGFVEALQLSVAAVGALYARIRGDEGAFGRLQVELDKSASRMVNFQQAIELAVNGQARQSTIVAAATPILGVHSSAVLDAAAAEASLAAGVNATGNAYVQQLVRMAENAKATEVAIAATEKLQKARADENAALVATAKLTGDAAAALTAQAAAALSNATAADAVVAARTREVAATNAAIAAIQSEGDSRGGLSDAMTKQIEALQLKLQAQSASLEQDRQAAIALDAQAAAARTAAAAYADNSSRILDYRNAMDASRQIANIFTQSVGDQTLALARMKEQLDLGMVSQSEYRAASEQLRLTKEQLARYTQDAASAEALFRDAVRDSAAATDLANRSAKARTDVVLAQNAADQAHYGTLKKQAEAFGDLVLAGEFEISRKYKEIEATRLSMQIKNLELDADRASIELQISALDQNDALYNQKKAELEIRLEIIKAKRIEADASREIISGIQAEIDALRNLQNVQANRAPSGGPAPAPSPTGSSGAPGTASGGSGGGGGRPATYTSTVVIDKAQEVLNNRTRTYTADDLPFLQEAKKQAEAARLYLASMMSVSAGSVSTAALQSSQAMLAATNAALSRVQGLKQQAETDAATADRATAAAAARKTADEAAAKSAAERSAAAEAAVQAAVADQQRAATASRGSYGLDRPNGTTPDTYKGTDDNSYSRMTGQPTAPVSTTTVVVNLNGTQRTIAVKDQAAAASLVSLLRQLETGASTAS